MNKNKNYIKALEEARLYHSQPEGLTNTTPTSQVDTLVIKQNNTIIILLLQVLQKLEEVIDKPETSKTKTNKDIDNLIQEFKNLEISKPFLGTPNIPVSHTLQFSSILSSLPSLH